MLPFIKISFCVQRKKKYFFAKFKNPSLWGINCTLTQKNYQTKLNIQFLTIQKQSLIFNAKIEFK